MLAEAMGEVILEQRVGRGFDIDKLIDAITEYDERCERCGCYTCRCDDDETIIDETNWREDGR